jgi:hypothetical protein
LCTELGPAQCYSTDRVGFRPHTAVGRRYFPTAVHRPLFSTAPRLLHPCAPVSARLYPLRASMRGQSPFVFPTRSSFVTSASPCCLPPLLQRELSVSSPPPAALVGALIQCRSCAKEGPERPLIAGFPSIPIYSGHLVDDSSLQSFSAVAADATSSSSAPRCPPTGQPAPSTSPLASHRCLPSARAAASASTCTATSGLPPAQPPPPRGPH